MALREVLAEFGLAWDRAVVSVQEAIARILRTLNGVQQSLGIGREVERRIAPHARRAAEELPQLAPEET